MWLSRYSLPLLLWLISGDLVAPTHSGVQVFMQQDVETILIKISLEEIEDTLSRVKSELQTAHKRIIDPMNKLAANTAKSQMDFLEKN